MVGNLLLQLINNKILKRNTALVQKRSWEIISGDLFEKNKN